MARRRFGGYWIKQTNCEEQLAVRLRLTRIGRRKRPYYRIVAVDSRAKRDGAFIEGLGIYHPLERGGQIEINADRALYWLTTGAEPSETVRSLLRREGIWMRFRLEKRGYPETQIQEIMSGWFAKHKAVREPVENKATQSPAEVPLATGTDQVDSPE